jgi:hypothetical protein
VRETRLLRYLTCPYSHSVGLDFISDITRGEENTIKELNQRIEQQNKQANENKPLLEGMRSLTPKELVLRFHNCFHRSRNFTGKIKFFNCSSGVNGGASFAKPTADLMRAYWPRAEYIGYKDDLLQEYSDYIANPEVFDLQKQLGLNPRPERRKLGKTTGMPAKDLHIKL